jgi:hypothetical protein
MTMTTIKQYREKALYAEMQAAKSHNPILKALWRESADFWRRNYKEFAREFESTRVETSSKAPNHRRCRRGKNLHF